MDNENKKKIIESKMLEILNVLDVNVDDGNRSTAKRIAKMYVDEVFANVSNSIYKLDEQMTVFNEPNQLSNQEELIIVKDIPFYSMCEHHFMPFFGKASIGYVANDKIIGLSKLPRIVKFFSKRPQVQERLVTNIGDYLYTSELNPCLVIVRLHDVHHTCVSARGIETECGTDTIYVQSGFDDNTLNKYKKEFLERIK